MTLATILTDLMGAAVFERFPNIRVVLGESGIGWIPYVLDRMDFEYQDQYQDLKLKQLPSEYWRRQCKATFQFDRVGTKLIEEMGVETLMWGSDYPHPDGVWPESKKYIDEQFTPLRAGGPPKFTCETRVRAWAIPAFGVAGPLPDSLQPMRRRRPLHDHCTSGGASKPCYALAEMGSVAGGVLEDGMAYRRFLQLLLPLLILTVLPLSAEAQPAPGGPPAVGVVRAERQQITQTDEFIGRIQAVGRV